MRCATASGDNEFWDKMLLVMQILFDTIMLMQQILFHLCHTRHDVKAQNLLLGKQGYLINMEGGIW